MCPQTLPIHELLRHTNLGALEAKRRHLERALDEYLTEFSACRCGPCFNNGVPILSGTSCKCQCPLGRKGLACEQMEEKGETRVLAWVTPCPGREASAERTLGLPVSRTVPSCPLP